MFHGLEHQCFINQTVTTIDYHLELFVVYIVEVSTDYVEQVDFVGLDLRLNLSIQHDIEYS